MWVSTELSLITNCGEYCWMDLSTQMSLHSELHIWREREKVLRPSLCLLYGRTPARNMEASESPDLLTLLTLPVDVFNCVLERVQALETINVAAAAATCSAMHTHLSDALDARRRAAEAERELCKMRRFLMQLNEHEH